MMNGLFGSLLPPVLGDVYREEGARSLGNALGAGRLPSGMGYNPNRLDYERSLAAYQHQHPSLYRQAKQQQSAATVQHSLMNLLANMGASHQVQTPRPPTEREIAVKELREFLGDDLWGFGYMEGLKRDFRDLY